MLKKTLASLILILCLISFVCITLYFFTSMLIYYIIVCVSFVAITICDIMIRLKGE